MPVIHFKVIIEICGVLKKRQWLLILLFKKGSQFVADQKLPQIAV
jgi:hypothetical protein